MKSKQALTFASIAIALVASAILVTSWLGTYAGTVRTAHADSGEVSRASATDTSPTAPRAQPVNQAGLFARLKVAEPTMLLFFGFALISIAAGINFARSTTRRNVAGGRD